MIRTPVPKNKKQALAKANHALSQAYYRSARLLEEAGVYEEAEEHRAQARKYAKTSTRWRKAARLATPEEVKVLLR